MPELVDPPLDDNPQEPVLSRETKRFLLSLLTVVALVGLLFATQLATTITRNTDEKRVAEACKQGSLRSVRYEEPGPVGRTSGSFTACVVQGRIVDVGARELSDGSEFARRCGARGGVAYTKPKSKRTTEICIADGKVVDGR